MGKLAGRQALGGTLVVIRLDGEEEGKEEQDLQLLLFSCSKRRTSHFFGLGSESVRVMHHLRR